MNSTRGVGMVALVGGRVMDDSGRFGPPSTVIVMGGTVVEVARGLPVPAEAEVVDCRDAFVLPGLVDMHVHLGRAGLDRYLAWGVTTVRDLGNDLDLLHGLRAEVQAGTTAGPRIFSSGNLVDGPVTMWPDWSVSVSTPATARAAVARLARAGVNGIKTYMSMTPELIGVVVDEARSHGLPVASHLGATTCLEAATAGVGSLEHACQSLYAALVDPGDLLAWDQRWELGQSRFWAGLYRGLERVDPEGERVGTVLRALLDVDIPLDPTLLVVRRPVDWSTDRESLLPALDGVPAEVGADWVRNAEWMSCDWTPADVASAERANAVVAACVARFVRLGGRIVVGTDTPFCFLSPGESLHQEMAALQAAGIPAREVLLGATRYAAEVLGWQDRVGSVRRGAGADLLVVEADPSEDVRHLRRMRMVMARGRQVRPEPGRKAS